jgi:TonB family protein
LLPPTSSLATRSGLRVEGDLAARQLLTVPELPSRTNTDLVGSSVVQVMVDGDGQTISAVLLAGSGDRETDHYALELARHVRFNSLRVNGPDRLMEKAAPLTWGKLVFDWHTVPPPPSNAPPSR